MTQDSAQNELNSAQLFSELAISDGLKSGINDLGYVSPTDFQKGVFENFQKGHHVVGVGSNYGKSLAFSLPILDRINADQQHSQALIVTESTLMADLCMKECRALGRHLGISVSNNNQAQLVVIAADDLAKWNPEESLESFSVVFLDGLSKASMEKITSRITEILSRKIQVLLFGENVVSAFNEQAPALMETAAFVSNSDQPKLSLPAKHMYVQANEAEPKVRALLGVMELTKPSAALVTCNEAVECDLLSRYLARYNYSTKIVSEENNRHGLEDALRELHAGSVQVVVCQNSLLNNVSLENLAFMINYDIFERPSSYEQATQFNKQAPGLTRVIVNILSNREVGMLGPIKAQCLIEFSHLALPSEDEVLDLCSRRIKESLNKEASAAELGQYEVLTKRLFPESNESLPILSFLLRHYFSRQSKPPREPRDSYRDRNDRSDRDRGRNSMRSNDRRQDRYNRNEHPHNDQRDPNNSEEHTSHNEPRERAERPQNNAPPSGITRLYITLGRRDGFSDLAGLAQYLSERSSVDLGHFSGGGMIRDTSAHIEVDDDVAANIITSLHNSARPQTLENTSAEIPATIICEEARATSAPRHHRRPMQRRRPQYSRRDNRPPRQ